MGEETKTQVSKTIGQHAYELNLKEPDTTRAMDLTEAQSSTWDQTIKEAYELGRKGLPNKDFYIEIQVKWEQILGRERPQLHQYSFVKPNCPSPQYDQTLYKYHHKEDKIEYLWTLPDKDTYNYYIDNVTTLHPDRWALLKFVLKDLKGDLLRQSKILNGEPVTEEN